MPGFSLTLLLLPTGENASQPSATEILSLLDDKPKVLGWKWTPATNPSTSSEQLVQHNFDDANKGDVLNIKAKNPNLFVDIFSKGLSQ